VVFALGLIKLSILFFYRKIFCSVRIRRSIFDIASMVMIGLVIIWMIAYGFGAIFHCGTDPSVAWQPIAIVSIKCASLPDVLEGYAISDFIMDVLIWSMPIPKVSMPL
jgi:hypothetical protein